MDEEVEQAIKKIADALPITYMPDGWAEVFSFEGEFSTSMHLLSNPMANAIVRFRFMKAEGLTVSLTVNGEAEVVIARVPIKQI